jgi:protein-disulfide isomerase
MAAAAQEVSQEAFWLVHDFLFTSEGQNLGRLDRKGIQTRLEQLLKGKGYDVKPFQLALENGKGKQRVLDDMALGSKLRISGTPTKIVNGDMIVGSSPEDFIDKYLER